MSRITNKTRTTRRKGPILAEVPLVVDGRSWVGAVDVGGMYGGVSAVGPSTAGKKEARMRGGRSICKVC